MNKHPDHHFENAKKRHERYFKKLAYGVGIAFILIATYQIFMHFHERAENTARLIGIIEKNRAQQAIIPTLSLMKELDDDQFWAIMDYYQDKAYQLEAPLLFEVARRYAAKPDWGQAQFWLFWGRFKLSYDAARCSASEEATAWHRWFDDYYANPVQRQINELIASQRGPDSFKQVQEETKGSLERVLRFEALYDQVRFPRYFCSLINQPYQADPAYIPYRQWQQVRRRLRQNAAMFILNDTSSNDEPVADDLGVTPPASSAE